MKKLFLPAIFPLLSLILISQPSADRWEAISQDPARNTLPATDSLTFMYAASNNVYYYSNKLRVDYKMSNFNTTTNRGVSDLLKRYELEAKAKKHKFLVILKVQNQEKLNEYSKSTIAMIKTTYSFKEGELNQNESDLIQATEKAFGIKSE